MSDGRAVDFPNLCHSLRVHAIEASSLGETQVQRWSEIQRSDSRYSSPFLTPGYTQLVARCCEGVRVGLLQSTGGSIVGFFPFQLVAPGHAKPVGTTLCDYQAVIVERGVKWSARELLSGCELDRWDFDHLLADQEEFQAFHRVCDQSPVIDLSQGFQAYSIKMKKQRRDQLFQASRRWRQMEREFGSVTFSAHEPDQDLLDRLLTIKAAQWSRSGWNKRFESKWERDLTRGLIYTDEPDFGGILTVLRVGDRPAALHLGLRSNTVWHYWITAYESAFARYSPGLVMLCEMIKSAQSLGLKAIDLGKEDFLYKRRLMSYSVPLAEGTVSIQSKVP